MFTDEDTALKRLEGVGVSRGKYPDEACCGNAD